MSELINISLETDLSEFTSTVTDGGDLSWSADAALGGTSGGMSLLIDDTTPIYGTYDLETASTSGTVRMRFYIDPNTLDCGSTSFTLLELRNSSASRICRLHIYHATAYSLSFNIFDDADSTDFIGTWTEISNEEHYVEFQIVGGSGTGTAQWWIDGESVASEGSKDNDTKLASFDVLLIGAAPAGDAIDAGTTGTFYIDEIVINDDGSEIGPVITGDLSASTSDGLTLGESMQSVALLGNIDVALDNANYQGRGVRII